MAETPLPVQGTWLPSCSGSQIAQAAANSSHAVTKDSTRRNKDKILCAATKTPHSQIYIYIQRVFLKLKKKKKEKAFGKRDADTIIWMSKGALRKPETQGQNKTPQIVLHCRLPQVVSRARHFFASAEEMISTNCKKRRNSSLYPFFSKHPSLIYPLHYCYKLIK